jgi:hypothetical protein
VRVGGGLEGSGWDTVGVPCPVCQQRVCLPRLEGRPAGGDFHKRIKGRGDFPFPCWNFKRQGGSGVPLFVVFWAGGQANGSEIGRPLMADGCP